MTIDEIETLIIDLLATEAGKDPVDLRGELLAAGGDMPVDSLLAAEVLVAVEERCGVSLPATLETASHLQSVTSFARAVWIQVEAAAADGSETAV